MQYEPVIDAEDSIGNTQTMFLKSLTTSRKTQDTSDWCSKWEDSYSKERRKIQSHLYGNIQQFPKGTGTEQRSVLKINDKSAATNGVTFSAIDAKRADGKMFDLNYEPLDGDGKIVAKSDATAVDWD